jgi:manganese/zinc/iron transport system permease protein
MMGAEFVQFSLTPILIGIFAAVACALPGNFLILRRQALIGDAISHVVLPGIVVGVPADRRWWRRSHAAGRAGAASWRLS